MNPRERAAFNACAFSLAEALGIQTALILFDGVREQMIREQRTTERIIWLVQNEHAAPPSGPEDLVLSVPTSRINRMGQINLGLYSAALRGYIDLDESVLCLSGLAGSGHLDLMLVTKPKHDFPWIRKRDLDRIRDLARGREFGRLLELALRFAAEGREGKPLGSTFVLGKLDELAPYLRQLILNPCKGHASRLRNIHNPDFLESLREFSALDGAIIVSDRGVVTSVGTYLDATTKNLRLRPGLGARHASAAAITKVTDSIAFAISESSGTVMLFANGRSVLELERPR